MLTKEGEKRWNKLQSFFASTIMYLVVPIGHDNHLILIFLSCLCIASAILTPVWLYHRMFIDSCKRLKIMKGSDAIGLGLCFYFHDIPNYYLHFGFITVILLGETIKFHSWVLVHVDIIYALYGYWYTYVVLTEILFMLPALVCYIFFLCTCAFYLINCDGCAT